jgi:hypothetical protein
MLRISILKHYSASARKSQIVSDPVGSGSFAEASAAGGKAHSTGKSSVSGKVFFATFMKSPRVMAAAATEGHTSQGQVRCQFFQIRAPLRGKEKSK